MQVHQKPTPPHSVWIKTADSLPPSAYTVDLDRSKPQVVLILFPYVIFLALIWRQPSSPLNEPLQGDEPGL